MIFILEMFKVIFETVLKWEVKRLQSLIMFTSIQSLTIKIMINLAINNLAI